MVTTADTHERATLIGVGGSDEVLSGAARAFTAWLEERHYAAATVRVYGIYIERLLAALIGKNLELDGVTIDMLYDFWCTLPSSAASRNQARKALVAFFRSRGARRGEPADELPSLPEPHRLPRPVDVDDFLKLVGAARDLGGMHEAVGSVLAYTGCRISELRLAKWSQFELRSSQPVWYAQGKGSGRKGQKVRQVPLHPLLLPVLERWRQECGSTVLLFPSDLSESGILSDTKMRSVVYDLAEHAGLDRVGPHRFRHTVGTLTLAASGDIRAVQELLGHANLATTQLYTLVEPGRLSHVVGFLPSVNANNPPGGTGGKEEG